MNFEGLSRFCFWKLLHRFLWEDFLFSISPTFSLGLIWKSVQQIHTCENFFNHVLQFFFLLSYLRKFLRIFVRQFLRKIFRWFFWEFSRPLVLCKLLWNLLGNLFGDSFSNSFEKDPSADNFGKSFGIFVESIFLGFFPNYVLKLPQHIFG